MNYTEAFNLAAKLVKEGRFKDARSVLPMLYKTDAELMKDRIAKAEAKFSSAATVPSTATGLSSVADAGGKRDD